MPHEAFRIRTQGPGFKSAISDLVVRIIFYACLALKWINLGKIGIMKHKLKFYFK